MLPRPEVAPEIFNRHREPRHQVEADLALREQLGRQPFNVVNVRDGGHADGEDARLERLWAIENNRCVAPKSQAGWGGRIVSTKPRVKEMKGGEKRAGV